ncbi:hypothetical protein F4677DRAFT_461255 [Hypoxylon crocopeplum]|nr:hypothetical protein F4677DRAFT_461255 [Hypoxylon crocopeplum]
MAHATQGSAANGTNSSHEQHDATTNSSTSTGRASSSAHGVSMCIASLARNDVPFAAHHHQHETTDTSVAARSARVQQEVDDALDTLNQPPAKYVLFLEGFH